MTGRRVTNGVPSETGVALSTLGRKRMEAFVFGLEYQACASTTSRSSGCFLAGLLLCTHQTTLDLDSEASQKPSPFKSCQVSASHSARHEQHQVQKIPTKRRSSDHVGCVRAPLLF